MIAGGPPASHAGQELPAASPHDQVARSARPSKWAATALLGAAGLALTLAASLVSHDPAIAWLSSEGDAAWILYPTVFDTSAHPLVQMATTFRREVVLDGVPRRATLRVRAFRRAVVRVNDVVVEIGDGGDGGWKSVRTVEVARLLREGINRLEVSVVNDSGPPALWLELRGDGFGVSTDRAWDASLAGATWRKAALAGDAPRGRRFDPERLVPSPWRSVRARWPLLLSLLLAATAAAHLASFASGRVAVARRAWVRALDGASPWPLRIGLLVAVVLWGALFARDLAVVPIEFGFDAPQHIEYVRYVLDRHALPLADEGWQMFQPPLYYVTVATALGTLGLNVASPAAATVIRLLGLALGACQLLLVAAVMRRAFPRSAWQQLAGLGVAAMLPCMLLLHQFPTNEILVAMLSSAVLLASWVLVESPAPSPRRAALLGLLLGLALLSKVSALLLVPVALGVTAARGIRMPDGRLLRRFAESAIVVLVALATCGWHFTRVWARFGTPFVGGWDPRPGMGWWVDPGYRTLDHFLRFGRVLESPVFAGLNGFWDGLYSTLWGDGMLSGLSSTAPLPPWWSPSLQSAGYLLALVPAAAVVLGAMASVWEWVRRPRAHGGMLIALALLVLVAQLWMSVKVPSVVEDKASYGLLALVPLCFFAVRGLTLLGGAASWRRALVLGAVGAWAATSYASLWADPSSADAQLIRGMKLATTGDAPGAIEVLRSAVRRDPGAWGVRVALARELMESGGPAEEIEALVRPGETAPARADRQLAIALWDEQRNDLVRAAQAARSAIALDPDEPGAHAALARVLEAGGELEGATQSWREVLRITPHDRVAHAALAFLYGTIGRTDRSVLHAGYAARLARASSRRSGE